MDFHEVRKDINGTLLLNASSDVNRQTLPGALVDDYHELAGPAVICSVKYKVPGPHMAPVLWPKSDTQPTVQPELASLGLLGRHFESFAAPDSHHPAMTNRPAVSLKQCMHAAITVTTVLRCNTQYVCGQCRLIRSGLRGIANRVPGNAQRFADMPL